LEGLSAISILTLFPLITITVTLPIEIIRKLKWRGGQKVVIKKSGKGIFIKDWIPKIARGKKK